MVQGYRAPYFAGRGSSNVTSCLVSDAVTGYRSQGLATAAALSCEQSACPEGTPAAARAGYRHPPRKQRVPGKFMYFTKIGMGTLFKSLCK